MFGFVIACFMHTAFIKLKYGGIRITDQHRRVGSDETPGTPAFFQLVDGGCPSPKTLRTAEQDHTCMFPDSVFENTGLSSKLGPFRFNTL